MVSRNEIILQAKKLTCLLNAAQSLGVLNIEREALELQRSAVYARVDSDKAYGSDNKGDISPICTRW